MLQKPEEGNQGYLIWKQDELPALIDWSDAVVKDGLEHRIKFARLVQRKASSPKAAGADPEGFCCFVQLALEGVPYHKPKHSVGSAIIGTDLGPSTIALVPREGQASLSLFCEELNRDDRALRTSSTEDGAAAASGQIRRTTTRRGASGRLGRGNSSGKAVTATKHTGG